MPFVDESSETANILKMAQCAMIVEPGDIEGIRSAILYLKDNTPAREAMGETAGGTWRRT